MRVPVIRPDWPESWRLSHHYDLLEVFGDDGDPAYSSAYRTRRERTLSLVRGTAAPGARILDVAAGQGNFTLALAELGYDTTWNDLRAELVGYVELKHEHGSVAYRPGNVFDLADGEPYDLVLATEVIEHVAHPDALLARLSALVRPGGSVVLTTPNGGFFRNPLPRYSDVVDPSSFEDKQFEPDATGHLWLLDDDELSELAVRAGLIVDDISYFTSPLTTGWLGLGFLTRRLPRFAIDGAEAVLSLLPRRLRRKVATHLALVLQRP